MRQEFKTQTSLMMRLSGSAAGAPQPGHAAGTTNWHGVGYDFLRNTRLNANDYFLNQSGHRRPVMHRTSSAIAWRTHPRVRDTFFFVNYEGMRQKNGVYGDRQWHQPVLPTARDNAFSQPRSDCRRAASTPSPSIF